MNEQPKIKLMNIGLILGITLLFQSSCSKPKTGPVVGVPTPPAGPVVQVQDPGFIQVNNFKFKLSPEIEKGGEAHLDLYIRNEKEEHVAGAKAVIYLTAADGHKLTVNLTEDKADKHYAGKTKLEDLGEYQAVAQVTINGEKYNPRFNFTRNK